MNAEFKGAQLRLARLFNGFTLEDVAEKIGRTRQYVHKIETGQGAPTDELSQKLADVLRVQHEFFYLEHTEISEDQVHFRKLFTTRTMIKQMALARLELFARLVNYFDGLLTLPTVNIPAAEVSGVDDIERAAEHCRSEWGLGHGPIDNMTRLAENIGAIVTSFQGVSKEIDALSVSARRPVIVRNEAKSSACRQRFDVAHELGHFVLHEGRITGDRISENEANRFASALLVPRVMMAKHFPRPRGRRLDWAGLHDFKITWKVSKAAALYRARQLDIITEDQYKSAVITQRRGGEAIGEKDDDLIPPERPDLLRRSFEVLAQRKNLYGPAVAASLRVQVTLLQDLTGFEVPYVLTNNRPALRLVS